MIRSFLINKYLGKEFFKVILNTSIIFFTLGFIMHLFEEINFFKSPEKKPIMLENLRSIFYKMELSKKETRILSGVFASLAKKR